MTTIREAKRLANPTPFLESFETIASAINTRGYNYSPENVHSLLLETDSPYLAFDVSMTDELDNTGRRTKSQLHISAIGPYLTERPSPKQAERVSYTIVPDPHGTAELYVPQYADMILEFGGQEKDEDRKCSDEPSILLSYAPLARRGAETVGLQDESKISDPAKSLLLQLFARQFDLPEDVLEDDIGLLADYTRELSTATGNSYTHTKGRVANYARGINGVDDISYLIATPIFPDNPPDTLTGGATLTTTTYRTKKGNLDEVTTTLVVDRVFTPQTVHDKLGAHGIKAAIAQRCISRYRGRTHHSETAGTMRRVNELTLPMVAIAQTVLTKPSATTRHLRPAIRSN